MSRKPVGSNVGMNIAPGHACLLIAMEGRSTLTLRKARGPLPSLASKVERARREAGRRARLAARRDPGDALTSLRPARSYAFRPDNLETRVRVLQARRLCSRTSSVRIRCPMWLRQVQPRQSPQFRHDRERFKFGRNQLFPLTNVCVGPTRKATGSLPSLIALRVRSSEKALEEAGR